MLFRSIFLGMCAGFYFSYEAGTLTKTIVSTLITFAFFFAFWIFGGIAEGDVKVLTMIGCFSGFWQTAEYLIVASVLSLIWVLLYKARYKRLREGIPLVSFLFVSFVDVFVFFFFFKHKTAYEIFSRDWSSDVCSSDLFL